MSARTDKPGGFEALNRLGWLFKKFDLVAIRVRYPCEFPIFVVFSLINRHALRLEMRKSFRHAFYAVVNLTRSWLIRDVFISGNNRPRYRSLDLRIFNIPIIKRCIDRVALTIFALSHHSETIAIPYRQSLWIV